MAKIIALANQKGGVGKTTTAVNLAASLALADRKTLLIDLDPQGNASSSLGVDKMATQSQATIYEVLIGQVSFKDIIRPTELDHLDLAPSNTSLAGAEIELVSAFARESKLRSAIAAIKADYDFILIDCPPSLGLLTINAFTAADSFLVPLQCEYFALEGLSQLMTTVGLIKQNLNQNIEHEGIVLTMYDSRNKLAMEVEKEARTHFGDRVFQTIIPRNIRLSECTSFGKPVVLYDVDSKGCVAYLNLAKEMLSRNQPKEAQLINESIVESKSELLVESVIQPEAPGFRANLPASSGFQSNSLSEIN